MVSSTKNNIINIYFKISKSFLNFLMKRVVLTFILENLFSNKKLLNLLYEVLGACFNPYNALDNLNTWFGKSKFSKLTFPFENPFSNRKLFNLSYQALGAYFNPYNALDNLNTWFERLKLSKPGGCST